MSEHRITVWDVAKPLGRAVSGPFFQPFDVGADNDPFVPAVAGTRIFIDNLLLSAEVGGTFFLIRAGVVDLTGTMPISFAGMNNLERIWSTTDGAAVVVIYAGGPGPIHGRASYWRF